MLWTEGPSPLVAQTITPPGCEDRKQSIYETISMDDFNCFDDVTAFIKFVELSKGGEGGLPCSVTTLIDNLS